ncbi:hypothetical protein [Brevundimonas sp. PWP3-1b1]|uniref:hypothetical protein n=1 Tax=unclassified Brevundimonas TaxID=2622653 RepID=UPI003CEFB619
MKGSTEIWLIRLSAILWFLILVGTLLSLPILFDLGWWAVLVVAVIAAILTFPIGWVIRRLFSRQRSQRWRTTVLKVALATFAVLSILAAAPIYYLAFNATLRPVTVPLATLSNGRQTVVFQGMMHIGTESFYKGVVYDLERALTEGYVLFYEGVQQDPSAEAWFSQTLAGGGDLSANYTALGKACGLDFQMNYFTLLDADKAAHPERHVIADVTTGDMKREYERLVRTDPAFAAYARSADVKDDEASGVNMAKALAWLDRATPGQQVLIGTACRGVLNIVTSNDDESDPINKVVLDYRNRELAARIAQSPADKIYVTYGAGHLPGLFRNLKAIDPAWEIKSIKWQRTIEPPETLSGRLK